MRKCTGCGIVFILMSFLCSLGSAKAQTVALSDDPNFIRASILIAEPGDMPYQVTGHAAIRMECAEHGFDRVFSFANDGANNIQKAYTVGALGGVLEHFTEDYLAEFRDEGREVKSYELNLSLNEKARLWEVLDEMKVEPLRDFNLVDSHCFSVMSETLEKAVFPASINWDEGKLQKDLIYGKVARISGGDEHRWNTLLINLALGSYGDTRGKGGQFVYPTIFEMEYEDFKIVEPGGESRSLIKGEPEVVLKASREDRGNRPTPVEAMTVLLLTVVTVTFAQYRGKWASGGRILDLVLWIAVTAGGVFIVFITYAPHHYGGSWNWPLVVMNPLAWVPVVLLRHRRRALRWVWMVYGAVLVVFAVGIGAVAPSVDAAWRILAVALAVRCWFKVLKGR